MKDYKNAALQPKERAELLLREMTLDEKMAQLVGVFAIKGYEDRMAPFFKNGIGQISTLEFRACGSMEEIAAWQRQLQTIVMEASRLHIPAVFHMEGLCGPLMQDTTTFPSGVARGSSFDPELERKIGETVSRQEAAFGITQIGRQCEPYGEDPTLAAAMGAAYTHLSMVEAQRAAKNSMAGVKGNGEVSQVSYVPPTWRTTRPNASMTCC